MTLKITNENRVWVKKVENKQKYGVITVTTSRKDKKNDKWVYSTFYVKLIGSKAFDNIDELTAKYVDGEKFENSGLLKKGFPINLKQMSLSNEPYEKEGEKIYQNMQLACWEWDWVEGEKPSRDAIDEEDENPFAD